jgi:hypothetical protein
MSVRERRGAASIDVREWVVCFRRQKKGSGSSPHILARECIVIYTSALLPAVKTSQANSRA